MATRSKTQARSTQLEWQAQLERTRQALGLGTDTTRATLEKQAQLDRTRQALGLGADTTRAKLEMYNAQLAQFDAVLAAILRLP